MSVERVIVFGNSGSGKSTLARFLCKRKNLAHLDLDTLAWQPGSTPVRCPIEVSAKQIGEFVEANPSWVIEGCYADLLALVIEQSTEIIYMNLPVDLCVVNARNREWEPHKYKSRAAQDANLEMLIGWIEQYAT